jgi:hypothetical protein
MYKRKKRLDNKPQKPSVLGIWYWHCVVCSKNYTKDNAHYNCYQRYCTICELSFISNEKLKDHIEKYHNNENIYCKICKMTFAQNVMANHNRTIHQKE